MCNTYFLLLCKAIKDLSQKKKKKDLKEMIQVSQPTGAYIIYATALALSLSCLFHCSYKKQSVNSLRAGPRS